jgi:anti-anti-sigma factor
MIDVVPTWNLEVERGPDWLFVKVRDLDEGSSSLHSFGQHVWSLMQQYLVKRLVLELNELGPLSSQGLGQLVLLQKRINAAGGQMRICGLSEQNREILQLCRLLDRFHPFEDRKDAVLGDLRHKKPR